MADNNPSASGVPMFSASAVAQRAQIVSDVKQAVQNLLFGKPNVLSVGVGFKNRDIQGKTEVCLVVGVDHKVPKDALDHAELVPPVMDGVRTDVIEMPPFRALGTQVQRLRPAQPGLSIGHITVTAGTFGCVVKRNDVNLILSNNHVLANSNRATLGSAIVQPGIADGGNVANDRIAELVEFVPLAFDDEPAPTQPTGCSSSLRPSTGRIYAFNQPGANRVDCALARPDGDYLISNDILGIGIPKGIGVGVLGMAIQKSGRTTGYTKNEIEQIDVTTKVEYDGKVATFTGQLMAGAMSAGGDSGSVVLDMSGNLVGLLFAGSDTQTLFNPIQAVIEALRISL